MSETLAFQADVKELMGLIIHALYSNRDVFLRELISNSSDACDKARLSDLRDNVLDRSYVIRVRPDVESKTLVISDTGIGMDRSDLVEHLSTIARSGTKEFIRKFTENKDATSSLIGKFGVGFYSAFLVSERVEVWTVKKDAEQGWKWSSDSKQSYTISSLSEEETRALREEFQGSGTRIVLYLTEDAQEYLQESKLRELITRHSGYVSYPVELYVTKTVEEETTATTTTEVEDEGDDETDEVVVEEGAEEEKDSSTTGKEKKTIQTFEKVNGERAVWYESKETVEKEAYVSLYKSVSKNYDEPLIWRHFQTEGAYEFRGILFIPTNAPFDFMANPSTRDKRNIRLYVRKVLVLQELDKDLLPESLSFISGVIDSPDIPLNVSREMLQQTKVLKALKSQLKKQIMSLLRELHDDAEKYKTFYKAFQKNIKLGIHEGETDFYDFLQVSCNSLENVITLEQYVEEYRKSEEQKSIYFITGDHPETNPIVRLYREKGYSVLFFTDSIDEFMLQRLTKYKDYEMVHLAKDHEVPWSKKTTAEDNKPTADTATTNEEDDNDTPKDQDTTTTQTTLFSSLLDFVKSSLDKETIEKVVVSQKFETSDQPPLVILSGKFGWSGQMEKLMAAQPLQDTKMFSWMRSKKSIELNVQNPLIQKLETLRETDPDKAKNFVWVLYVSACATAGHPIEETIPSFISSLYSVLV